MRGLPNLEISNDNVTLYPLPRLKESYRYRIRVSAQRPPLLWYWGGGVSHVKPTELIYRHSPVYV
jgi:hypothetical protein